LPYLSFFRCRLAAAVIAGLYAVCALAANPSRINELSTEDQTRLQRGRVLIQRYLADDDARAKYQTVPGKLGALRAIMKIEPLHPARKDLMEAMGVVVGDTFVQDMGFRWVAIENESGRHVVIRYRRTNIFLYPLTLISERVQRGERFDALDLYNDLAADVEDAIAAGSR
jgi:hypothetical protein